jgi:hypothetical protein
LLGCLAWSSVAGAQRYAHPWDPRSGDAWTDRQLADVNVYATRYHDAFVDELVRYLDAPRALVDDLVVEQRWAPADVYYACAIARVLGRPCRTLTDLWAQRHAEGWEAVRAAAGIEPGTPAAARLRQAFVDSYARWARPLDRAAGTRAAPDAK